MIMVSVMSVSLLTASTFTLTAFISSSAFSTTLTTGIGLTALGAAGLACAAFFLAAAAGPLLASFLRAVLNLVTLPGFDGPLVDDAAVLRAPEDREVFARLTAMLTSWLAFCNSR